MLTLAPLTVKCQIEDLHTEIEVIALRFKVDNRKSPLHLHINELKRLMNYCIFLHVMDFMNSIYIVDLKQSVVGKFLLLWPGMMVFEVVEGGYIC